MKTYHTPGPWFLFGNGHCVGGPLTVDPTGSGQITAGIALCNMRLRTEEENEANARLVVAAPELLAACDAMHTAIDSLFALLITEVRGFRPSECGQAWAALVQGLGIRQKARGED